MGEIDQQIIRFIKKASRRIKMNRWIHYTLQGLFWAGCVCSIIQLFSLIWTFKYALEACYISIGIGLLASGIYSIIKAPSKREVALIADSKGLKERVTTALDFLGKEEGLCGPQKKDTLEHIKAYDFKKQLPIQCSKKAIGKVILVMVIAVICSLIPTPAKLNEKDFRLFEKSKNQVVKKIVEEKKAVEKVEELTKEERKALEELLKKTAEELKKTEEKEKLQEGIERLDKKLDNFEKELKKEAAKKKVEDLKKALTKEALAKGQEEAKKELNQVAKQLENIEQGKKLAEALQSEDPKKLQEAIKQLEESLSKMSGAEKSKLSKALSQAAGKLNDSQLQQALSQASSDVLEGTLQASDLQGALAKLQSQAGKGQGKKTGDGQGQGQGNGQGQGSGNGNGNGKGNGNGNGSGNGSGNGQGGGWNTGSKIGYEELPDQSSKDQMDNQATVGSDENLQGQGNGTGQSMSIEVEKGLNISGNKVEYDEVIGDYTKEAIEGLENDPLPEAMKEAIRQYFNEIN